MRALTFGITCFCLVLGISSAVSAQEGHPMSGVWVGDWGTDDSERHRVVIVMEWTGSQITGTINPGPDAIPIESATVDPENWSLHLEAEATDAEGRPVSFLIDGSIDDLGTYNRTIAGTWNTGDMQGNFSITRQ